MLNGFLPLKKNADFRSIYSKGKSVSTKNLVLYFIETEAKGRVGFVASKKIGKATIRNRSKRVIKEAFKISPLRLSREVDLIFLARPKIVEADFDSIKRDITYLTKRANKVLMEKKDG